MSRARTHAKTATTTHAVSRPHEPAEQQADKAADVVARGGSVTGWSFASVAASAPVHRQGDGKSADDDKNKKEPDEPDKAKAEESTRRVIESPAGEKVQQSIFDLPEVKKAVEFAKSPAGIGLGIGVGAAGVMSLAASHQPLPFQPPAIPLDGIGLKGVSAKVEYKGPVDRPTGVGLSLSYTPPGPAKKGPSDSDKYRAETARLRAEQEKFRAGMRYVPGSQAARDQQAQDKATQQAVADYVAQHSMLPGVGKPLIPAEGGKVETKPAEPGQKPPEPEQKKPDEAPVQREPASTSERGADQIETRRLDDALRGSGRPLDPSVRRSMEARFGYDFGNVRLHNDAAANAAAADAHATAFTVGQDIVLGVSGLDTRTAAGRRLLAHELAHVVQQSGSVGPVLQRRSIFESIGIWLGLIEGTWDDRELHAYLDAITATDHIDGAYDADNKARAITRRWKRGSPGYDLRARQKALMIAEMLDGATLGDDEECILDLLELSDASDLRAMFGSTKFTLGQLESDINGSNHDRLESFLNSRFQGGRDAVAAGQIVVIGPPVPAGAPAFAFDAATVDSWVDSDRTSEEIIAIIDHLAPDARKLALHHLSQVRRPTMLTALQTMQREAREATSDPARRAKEAIVDRQRQLMLRVERVLLHFFFTAIPATQADLIAGTSPTDPARQAELRDALRPTPGGAHHFRDQIPGEPKTYEQKLRDMLPGVVNDVFNRVAANRPPRTHTLTEYEALANVSADETDKVFGRFYTPKRPAFVADRPHHRGNLHDALAEVERQQRGMTALQRRSSALGMLQYLITTEDAIADLNRHHDADPEFDHGHPTNDEAKIQDTIARDFVRSTANVTLLLDIDRHWDAAEQQGEVLVQLYQPTDPAADRLVLWDVFQTLIHEYLHTLVAQPYEDYANSFGDETPEQNTLIEGMDSVLDEIVWEHVEPQVKTHDLRVKVEGAATAALPPIDVPHPSQRRYDSYTEALKLIDLVGIQNVYAAYFLGLVDRIGAPPAPTGHHP
jgi:hypothetical protein